MELTNEVIGKMTGNSRLMNLIAAEMNCSEATVRRWIANNNPMLTTASVVKINKTETGLTNSQILTEKKATA